MHDDVEHRETPHPSEPLQPEVVVRYWKKKLAELAAFLDARSIEVWYSRPAGVLVQRVTESSVFTACEQLGLPFPDSATDMVVGPQPEEDEW